MCTQCLQDNPYAIWLIKLKCFKPGYQDHNYPIRKVLVSIEAMRLVKMRQHSPSIEGRSEPLPICQSLPYSQCGNNCPFPHSQVEFETWEFIRTLFKGKYKANHTSYWCMHIYNVIEIFTILMIFSTVCVLLLYRQAPETGSLWHQTCFTVSN